METIDFNLSTIPMLDEYGEEALAAIFKDLKENPSDKPRKLTVTVLVDPKTLEITSRMKTTLPSEYVWEFKTLQGIRENGTIRIEKPVQAGLFEGSK